MVWKYCGIRKLLWSSLLGKFGSTIGRMARSEASGPSFTSSIQLWTSSRRRNSDSLIACLKKRRIFLDHRLKGGRSSQSMERGSPHLFRGALESRLVSKLSRELPRGRFLAYRASGGLAVMNASSWETSRQRASPGFSAQSRL